MTRRRLSAVCILLAAFFAPVPFSAAQMGLDRQIVTTERVSSAQNTEIERYVSEWMPRLGDQDPRESRRSREQLLQPLRERSVSVAFRLAYSDRLVPGLTEHAQGQDDRTIVNVLRIAGELATPASVNLLQAKLQDAQIPVRYAAASNIGVVFAVVRDHSPAMGQGAVQQLVTRLDNHIQREREAEVLDVSVRSLAMAMEITRPNYESIRPAAFASLTQRMSERAKGLGNRAESDELLRVFLRAAHVCRDALADNARPLGDQGVRQAAELNGHLLAYIVRRLQGGGFPIGDQDGRYVAAQVVTIAETTIIMSAAQLRAQIQPANLSTEFLKATSEADRVFRDRAVDLLGVLTRPPFNFGAAEFAGR